MEVRAGDGVITWREIFLLISLRLSLSLEGHKAGASLPQAAESTDKQNGKTTNTHESTNKQTNTQSNCSKPVQISYTLTSNPAMVSCNWSATWQLLAYIIYTVPCREWGSELIWSITDRTASAYMSLTLSASHYMWRGRSREGVMTVM